MANAGEFPKSSGDIIYAADLNQLRKIPQASSAGEFVLTPTNTGQHVPVTGSIKIPASGVTGITSGDSITVYNPGPSVLTISVYGTPSVPPLYYIVGTSVKPTSLAVNGLATFLCVDTGGGVNPAKFIVIGGGIS